jgi:hypothetical protein
MCYTIEVVFAILDFLHRGSDAPGFLSLGTAILINYVVSIQNGEIEMPTSFFKLVFLDTTQGNKTEHMRTIRRISHY